MVFFLLMIGGQVEPQDIVNEQDYFDPEEDFKVDLVKEEREAEWMEDWPLCRGKASALMEEEVWIGRTSCDVEENSHWIGPSCLEVKKPYYQNRSWTMWTTVLAQVEDWCLDLRGSQKRMNNQSQGFESLVGQEVEDWSLDYMKDHDQGLNYMMDENEVVQIMNGDLNYTAGLVSMLLWNYVPNDLVEKVKKMFYEELMGEKMPWGILVTSCVCGALIWTAMGPMRKKCLCRRRLDRGHLSYKRRKWKGNLQKRFQHRLRLRGMVFLSCLIGAQSMDAAQAAQMMNQMMQMTEAATNAARVSALALEKMEQKKSVGSFGEASKVLRPPESLDGDDPLRYVSWRESFMNWLTYGDPRFSDLLRDVENLDEPCKLSDFANAEVRELARRLYSILASYVRGPALQLIRAESSQKNGFLVWQQLRDLYMPRARPRTMAIGQAIMSHPSFPREKSMLENLLQMDLLLDQYRVASGHPMPDDLVVSTILRCIDPNVRRHLELTMDDSMTYNILKEKLILMDKNSRVWSGDSYLKLVQNSLKNDPSGSAPMEVDSKKERER